jgi:hypothetical protein
MSCDLDDLKAKLKEATEAYHQLMMGGSVRVFVDQNAERIEYTAANKQNLWNYIISLRSMICAIAPSDPDCVCGIGVAKGPARFIF